MSNGELILYTTEDGKTAIHLKAEGETVWLTQLEIADLFHWALSIYRRCASRDIYPAVE